MRKQLLGLLVPLLAFVVITIAAAADMTGKGVAASSRLQRIEVAHSQVGLQVEFKAEGGVAPKVTTLGSPARIVVDFPNTVMATAQSRISVGRDGVKDVRVGMDGQVPPTTRVVIDLANNDLTNMDLVGSRQHELVAAPNGSFVLKIHDAVLAHRQPAPAAKPVAASAAPQLVLASAPVSPAPAAEVAPTPAAAENAQKPVDFAFVEPKFSVKDDKAAEPAAKAQEAAGRFADKTAAELVATNANAALGQAGGNVQPIQPAVNLAAEQKVQMEQKPAASGAKYTGEPISVNLKDVDLKDFFRLIHEISGLNVVLDPMVHGSLTIVLDDVPWDQALDIVLKNNDLSRQLDGNVLRIATIETLKKEAEGRRSQIDAEALAVDKVSITRFLSYAHAKDLLVPIKKFLSQRGDIVADERTNALIVSDIPAVLPQIDRLIQQMDRKTQEVEIEARVVGHSQLRSRHRRAARLWLGQRHNRRWRRKRCWNLADHRRSSGGKSVVPRHRYPRERHSNSVVFESRRGRADQRSGTCELFQQHADRPSAYYGRVAWVAESSFPSAHRHPEQHSGGGETGHEDTDHDRSLTGRSGDRFLRGCFPATDSDSADHIGRDHLPQRGCGKHIARL